MKTDSQIQRDVMDELKWLPSLKASEIGVAVKEGIVTLSGTVDSYSKKITAESAAKRIHGVRAVAEDIEVRLLPDSTKSDTDLAAVVLNALRLHAIVQDEKLQVKVDNGWVTLEGDADWGFQKAAAENAIEDLKGVKGVINNIKVVPQIGLQDVKRQISLAFQRNATIDSEKIIVETSGDHVILKGTVRTLVEKKDAEKAAWAAPGVRLVENRLEVNSGISSY